MKNTGCPFKLGLKLLKVRIAYLCYILRITYVTTYLYPPGIVYEMIWSSQLHFIKRYTIYIDMLPFQCTVFLYSLFIMNKVKPKVSFIYIKYFGITCFRKTAT